MLDRRIYHLQLVLSYALLRYSCSGLWHNPMKLPGLPVIAQLSLTSPPPLPANVKCAAAMPLLGRTLPAIWIANMNIKRKSAKQTHPVTGHPDGPLTASDPYPHTAIARVSKCQTQSGMAPSANLVMMAFVLAVTFLNGTAQAEPSLGRKSLLQAKGAMDPPVTTAAEGEAIQQLAKSATSQRSLLHRGKGNKKRNQHANGNGNQWGQGNRWGKQNQQDEGNSNDNPWRNNRQVLTPVIGDISRYSNIEPQAIRAAGRASALARGIRRHGNAHAAAESLAQAWTSNQSDAAAQAVASAAVAISSGGDPGAIAEAAAVSETLAEAAAYNPSWASNLYAKSAGYAVSRGQTRAYARSVARAFAFAKQRQYVPQMTTAVADAITSGGSQSRYAYGQAIATAIAEGGDSSAAVAEATATAICTGGSTANAWASAYAVALSQDSRGCLVLDQAKAQAQAKCRPNGVEAFSNSDSSSRVLGFCGLLDSFPAGVDLRLTGSSSGSSNGLLGLGGGGSSLLGSGGGTTGSSGGASNSLLGLGLGLGVGK